MKKIEVKEIVLDVNGKELKLTPKQAEELYDALRSLLGKPSMTYTPSFPNKYDRAAPYYPPTVTWTDLNAGDKFPDIFKVTL